MKPFAENRKARHDYEVLETYEGGLQLLGHEVKSIRDGGAKIVGAYLRFEKGELWLVNMHVRPYAKAGKLEGYDPDRLRKVLMQKKELLVLFGKTQQKGLTLVPFSLYSRGRHIKLSFGVCRGRKSHDKREKLKSKAIRREIQAHL